MADETLSFSIIARDQASSAFRETARSASDLAGKMDIAARTGRVLDDTLRKEVRAGDELTRSFGVSAKAADVLKRAEDELAGKTALATHELSKQDKQEELLTGKAKARLLDIRATAERLKADFPELVIQIDDAAAKRRLAVFAAETKVTMDKVSRELSGAGRGGILSRVGGLFGGSGAGAAASTAGGAVGGGAQAGSGLTAFAAANPEVAAGAAAAAIASLPFIAQAAAGGIVTALGGGLAAVGIIGASKTKAVQRDFTDLKNTAEGAFKPITSSFDTVLQGILKTATTSLPSILGAVSTALQSIAGPFEQVGKTIAKAFGDPAVTTSIKAIGTAFGAVLKALAPSLPGIIDSIATGITRIANTIKDNPKAFADLIWFLGHTISAGLDAVAALSSVATYIEKHFVPVLQRYQKNWDQLWNDSIGVLIRFGHDAEKIFDDFRHRTAVVFDGVRHDIAHTWDQIWNNTIGRVQNGISDVIGWFKGLPGRAVGALFGLGHSLAAFARSAINEMWTGFKNTFSAVIHWFEGLPRTILHALGIHSPPGWAVSAGKFIMQGLHIGLGHGLGQLTNFTTGIGATVAAGLSGAVGGSGVTRWAPLILKVLAMLGQSSANLGAVEHRMAQESGGNPRAINLTDINAQMGDPSRGLMQTIGTTFAAYRSWSLPNNIYNPEANIFAGLNYALHAYPGRSLSSVMLQPGGYAYGTSSAAPGWAWVGERGPELMKFRGGEQVIPARAGTRSGPIRIELTVRTAAGAVVEVIQHHVSVNGGNVQVALGEHY